jgi:ribosomal protein S2
MRKLEELLARAEDESSDVKLNKKERLSISRQLEKLEANIGGIRHMRRVPDIMFVLDVSKEDIAVAEARRLKIPVVAITDTNVDPDQIDFPIPSNDDAARTIKLMMSALADVVLQARKVAETRNVRSDDTESSSDGGRQYRRGRGGDHRRDGGRQERGGSGDAPKVEAKGEEREPLPPSAPPPASA